MTTENPLTKEKINSLIDTLSDLRTQAFKSGTEEVYRLLGRSMGALMDIRTILSKNLENIK